MNDFNVYEEEDGQVSVITGPRSRSQFLEIVPITITDLDIRRGMQTQAFENWKCLNPIAIAINRHLVQDWSTRIGTTTVQFYWRHDHYYLQKEDLPTEMIGQRDVYEAEPHMVNGDLTGIIREFSIHIPKRYLAVEMAKTPRNELYID